MTNFEGDKLPRGLYLLYWADGGMSAASVGRCETGRSWYAASDQCHVPQFDWSLVKYVERIDYRHGGLTTKSVAELFMEVSGRCPHQPGSPEYIKWVHDEIHLAELLAVELGEILRLKETENEKHQRAMRVLENRLREAQKKCRHKMVRSVAESDPTCCICGWAG